MGEGSRGRGSSGYRGSGSSNSGGLGGSGIDLSNPWLGSGGGLGGGLLTGGVIGGNSSIFSMVNWAGTTSSIPLYEYYSPAAWFSVSSQYSVTIANGSPNTISISPSDITLRRNYSPPGSNGFSIVGATSPAIGYGQTLWGEALNGYNSSSGINYNPIEEKISMRLQVNYGNLTATQTINVKGGLDPVISGGALTVGAIILAVAIPGPIDDGALAGAGYAVCRTIQLCR